MIYCFIKTSITYDDLEHVILTKDEAELKSFSLPLDKFTDELHQWVSSTFNGIVVSKALDIFCIRINDETKLPELKQFLQKWFSLGVFTVYCGMSNKIDEAYKALLFAEHNQLKTIMPYSEEVEDFLDKTLEKMEPMLDKLAKMALKDISIPDPATFRGIKNSYDYSSLLPQEFQGSHKLIVTHHPYPNRFGEEPVDVVLHRKEWDGSFYSFGILNAHHFPNDKEVHVHYARLGTTPEDRKPYIGKHIGRAMYEALLAHSANKIGAQYISGTDHSSLASKAHQALSKKHGLNYRPRLGSAYTPNPEEPGANDFAYEPYRYKIG